VLQLLLLLLLLHLHSASCPSAPDAAGAAAPAAPAPAAPAAPAPAAPVADDGSLLSHSQLAQILEGGLATSKATVPHYYVNMECNVGKLTSLLAEVNANVKSEEDTVTVRDVAVKAAAMALNKMPEVNSVWTETAMRQLHSCDVCVNVPSPSGLVSVSVKDAQNKGFAAINQDVKALASALEDTGVTLSQATSGALTVTHMGDLGGQAFTAIVAPNQSVSLSVGHTYTKVTALPTEDCAASTSSHVLLSTSFDHRVIDGAVGAAWLNLVKEYMENPMKLLL